MRNVLADPIVAEHRNRLVKEVDTFLIRAGDEGLLRPDLPPGWVNAVLPSLMTQAAERLADLTPAQAADLVVETLLRGVGALQPNAA
jgi:hypothetical protein